MWIYCLDFHIRKGHQRFLDSACQSCIGLYVVSGSQKLDAAEMMSNGISSGSLRPTWFGHVATAKDALVLFEACLNGTLHHVPRRPHDRERSSLIKSGYVFIYEENASGIKRWTDGVPWSPSRILGNFLVYRELVKPFPPGEKKRAQKRPKNARPAKQGEPYPRRASGEEQPSPVSATRTDANFDSRESERSLIGSLVDSYGFKEGGLVKKTMSVTLHGIHHHLVSYYRIEDVLEGTLQPPSKDQKLENIEPRHELMARQNFRAPLDDPDMSMQDPMISALGTYELGRNTYRHPTIMSPLGQSQQSGALAMGGYSGTPFSSASQIQPGLQSYAGVGQQTQPYFSPSSSIPQAMVPKQEPFTPFNSNYAGTQSSQLSMQDAASSHSQNPSVQPYQYRHDAVPSMTSRVNSLGQSAALPDTKSFESSDWHRTGQYPSMTSPLSAQSPYGSGASQWAMASSLHHNMPRSEDGWSAVSVTSHYNMNTGQEASRPHPNFHMSSQSG